MPYFSHGETKNKLIILYILARAGSLLTREQLYRTAILNSEMEYFAFEQAVSELEEDGMLAEVRRAFGECLGLTDAGREALALFEKSVPADERKKLDSYLDENRGAFFFLFMSLAVGASGGACQDRQVNLPQSPGRVIDAHPSLGEKIIPRSESHHPFAN